MPTTTTIRKTRKTVAPLEVTCGMIFVVRDNYYKGASVLYRGGKPGIQPREYGYFLPSECSFEPEEFIGYNLALTGIIVLSNGEEIDPTWGVEQTEDGDIEYGWRLFRPNV